MNVRYGLVKVAAESESNSHRRYSIFGPGLSTDAIMLSPAAAAVAATVSNPGRKIRNAATVGGATIGAGLGYDLGDILTHGSKDTDKAMLYKALGTILGAGAGGLFGHQVVGDRWDNIAKQDVEAKQEEEERLRSQYK